MAKDNRKKGCPNKNCDMNKNKVRQNCSNNYCPKCGTKLIYVCSKCFDEIEDLGSKHKICAHCEQEAREKKQKVIDGAKDVAQEGGKLMAKAVVPVVVGVAAKVVKDGKKVAIDKGVKIVEGAAKAMIKK